MLGFGVLWGCPVATVAGGILFLSFLPAISSVGCMNMGILVHIGGILSPLLLGASVVLRPVPRGVAGVALFVILVWLVSFCLFSYNG